MATNQQILNKLNKIENTLNQMERKMNHDFHHLENKIQKLQKEIVGLESNTVLLKRIDTYTTYTACLAAYNSAVVYDPTNETGTLYSCASLLANSVNYISSVNADITAIVDYDSDTVIEPTGFLNLNLAMLTTLNFYVDPQTNDPKTGKSRDFLTNRPADLRTLETNTDVGGQERSDYFINNILTNINENLPIKYRQPPKYDISGQVL